MAADQGNPYSFATLGLHAGQASAPIGAVKDPASLLHSFAAGVWPDCDTAAACFNLEIPGHIDSLMSNPVVAMLEERMAALEGGVGAVATASGPAALFLAVATLMGSGGHIVAQCSFNAASYSLLRHTLPRFGIETTLIDDDLSGDVEAWSRAIRPNTRLVFGEAFSGLTLRVLDIPGIAGMAHAHGLPFLLDATLATPCLLQAFEQGADLVLHSAGEFLCGHGAAVGGLLVDSGGFDWEGQGAGRGFFPTLTEPFAGLSGIDFAEESLTTAFLQRARHEGLRHFGVCLAPMNAFRILQGVETLSLRMARHIDNARKVAAFLADQGPVVRVFYPGSLDHPDHALAGRLYPKGAGGVLAFEIQGGQTIAFRFIEALRLFSHAAYIGGAKSTAIHPATTTHRHFDPLALVRAGITPGAVRLSIGLEEADDLLEDLTRALAYATKS